MLVDEIEDNEGEEDSEGELVVEALDAQRGRAVLTMEGNGAVAPKNTLLAFGILCNAIFRSVCRLF